jgi:hypothetical protein
MYKRSRKQIAKQLKIGGWSATTQHLDHPVPPKAIQQLESKIQGSVVVSTDPTYHADRQEANPAFQDFPQLIVFCEVFDDVQRCLELAQKYKLWLVPRAGGHSTAGYSVNSGIVIDVSRIRYTVVDTAHDRKHDHRLAIVGAGTNFGHLNAVLDGYRLHVPGGGCEDVCVAGYMQGGGFGFTSREYGMNCDNVIDALVMLHDGRIVLANATQNADLFWAIRGGTGNNFGVLLQASYQLHELWNIWGFWLQWPLRDAPAALVEMQHGYMRGGASSKLGYMTIIANQDNVPYLLMRGVYHGPPEDGRRELAGLLRTPGAALTRQEVGPYLGMNQALLSQPFDIPQVPDVAREDKQSGYIATRLTEADWRLVCDRFEASPNQYTTIVIEPYGGAISAWPQRGNAFIHRDVDMDLFVDVFWLTAREEIAVRGYLDEFIAMMRRFMNGHAYQNYPRRHHPNYRWEYWGDAFNSLLAVKAKYDPDGVFHFEQGVSPVPADAPPEVVRDATPCYVPIAEPIVVEPYSKTSQAEQ